MAERRFVKRGEYELFLDEEYYNAVLHGGGFVYVSWHGWHRTWNPSSEAREQIQRGVLFRDRRGNVMLDLLMPGSAPALQLVKLHPQSECSIDFISFVVNV